MNRAAIVIGVNQAGKLPALADALASAERFAQWLEDGEKFTVQRFIASKDCPVEVKPISKAIAKLVKAGNLDQLVVYFSGHGFLVGDAEMWMLSEAPEFSAEAVNLTASVQRARESGIPHIVFISDACRSIPETFQAALVEGSSIFPNPTAAAQNEVVVDRFFAAKPTEAALELKAKEAAEGYSAVYTKALLEVFEEKTPAELVLTREIDGQSADVVPNRRLKAYLRERVPLVLAAGAVAARQRPDAYIECDDTAFVGRAKDAEKPVGPDPGTMQPATDAWIKTASRQTASTAFSAILSKIDPDALAGAEDVATDELAQQFAASKVTEIKDLAILASRSISDEAASSIETPIAVQDFFAQTKNILAAKKGGVEKFETKTGFEVRGARIRDAVAIGMLAEVLKSRGPGDPYDVIRLSPPDHIGGATLIIQLEDGSGVAVAGISGFIGSVIFENGLATDISYQPSTNSGKWLQYGLDNPKQRLKVETLQAMAAAAASNGDFRVRPKDASQFADRIRVGKGCPSSGFSGQLSV